jgi:branched-chain amino acid aminotransferase
MFVYSQGSCREAETATVSLFDGGYLHGDGLRATVRLYRGRPFDLEGHLKQLQREADALGLGRPPEPAKVREILVELFRLNEWGDRHTLADLRLSRANPRCDPDLLEDWRDCAPTLTIVMKPVPPEWSLWHRDGVSVQIVPPAYQRGSFPHLQTLNELPSIMARRGALAAGCAEALLTDPRGRILEGSASSLFLIRDGGLLTPPVRLGLTPRRARTRVLTAAQQLGHPCQEIAVDRPDLVTADEVFISCSAWEILPVIGLEKARLGTGKPGPVTRLLQKKYRQDVDAALAEKPA